MVKDKTSKPTTNIQVTCKLITAFQCMDQRTNYNIYWLQISLPTVHATWQSLVFIPVHRPVVVLSVLSLTCHFFTNDLSLSVVMVIPWKLVSTCFPCTSSTINLNFLNATSSSCRSASDTSNTLPFNPSDASSTMKKGEYTRWGCYQIRTLSLRLRYDRFTNISVGKHNGCFHIIPFLLCERINAEMTTDSVPMWLYIRPNPCELTNILSIVHSKWTKV